MAEILRKGEAIVVAMFELILVSIVVWIYSDAADEILLHIFPRHDKGSDWFHDEALRRRRKRRKGRHHDTQSTAQGGTGATIHVLTGDTSSILLYPNNWCKTDKNNNHPLAKRVVFHMRAKPSVPRHAYNVQYVLPAAWGLLPAALKKADSRYYILFRHLISF